jgi:DNA-binding transcriptional regulator YhcF (GntR family)
MEFNSKEPIYTQLVEVLRVDIASGKLAPGERLESAREMASRLAVNPNTAQRALAELERSGLVIAQRSSGRNVTTDEALIKKQRAALVVERLEKFLDSMYALGFSLDEVRNVFVEECEHGKH